MGLKYYYQAGSVLESAERCSAPPTQPFQMVQRQQHRHGVLQKRRTLQKQAMHVSLNDSAKQCVLLVTVCTVRVTVIGDYQTANANIT